MKKKKILLIYTKAGGGHLAACQAIMESMELENPGLYEFELLDVFENAPDFIKNLMNQGYVKLIYNFRPIWNVIYFLFSLRFLSVFFIWIYKIFASYQFLKNVKKINPDGIIYTYFVSSPANHVLKKAGQNIKNITIVTDLFTPPKVWFLNKNLQYIVASEEAKKIGLKMGVLPDNIKVFQGLVHPKFEISKTAPEIEDIKNKLGLNPQFKTVLFSGGGLGLKQTTPVLKKLIKENIGLNLLVVCGRNARQFKKVKKIIKKNTQPNLKIIPFNFVSNMDELIAICDLGITKAGPATMMEFFLQGKNIVLTDYIWGQEVGNYEFIVRNKFGIYESEPEKIAESLINFSKTNDLDLKKPVVKNEILQAGKYLDQFFKS